MTGTRQVETFLTSSVNAAPYAPQRLLTYLVRVRVVLQFECVEVLIEAEPAGEFLPMKKSKKNGRAGKTVSVAPTTDDIKVQWPYVLVGQLDALWVECGLDPEITKIRALVMEALEETEGLKALRATRH